ncbi:prepilin peptidase-dependent protein C [Escherichia coli]|uniref:Prepilin peptidase-dependent protein C n=1 Tax=Escherichia coli TaxID=562 RepID=A0A377DMG5_ECOLX|nr:prepilin peptidase-dependent protein C [Escherichia coli]
MVLMVMIVTALSGFPANINEQSCQQKPVPTALAAWLAANATAARISPPANWQVNRMQTSQAGCVSISVTLVSPGGREGEMTRLHCPNRQ